VDWSPYPMATSGIRKGRANHSDCLGGALIWVGYPYGIARDVLPAEARAAYETGLKKLVLRLNQWGPTALMTDMDLFAPVGLWYISRAMDDPQVKQIAESYSRTLYTNPRYFSPAGYFVDIQGFDASYNGISLYYATWAALLTDWPFAREALDKASRLKAHLALPEPDGKTFFGPSHFSPRTSTDCVHDQWNFPPRNPGAAMVTLEALYLTTPPPSLEGMANTIRGMVGSFNAQQKAVEASQLKPWGEKHFINTINYSHDYYVPGTYEKLVALYKAGGPLRKPPFCRDEGFVRHFGNEFLIAKSGTFGAVIHTGPVGEVEADWPTRAKWMPTKAPFGFSGGALSAFWTPQCGPVILGRRRGAQGEVPDKYEDWRIWPFHAVSGQTAEGRVFTSGRILKPEVPKVSAPTPAVMVKGDIPKSYTGYGESLKGTLRYERIFEVLAQGVRIQTSVQSDGQDRLAEMCETIPIFLGEGLAPTVPRPVSIQFQAGDQWRAAGTDFQSGVKAVKVTRFGGAILITFDQPQRVKLSPQDWQDNYQSRATCRTILIDLLGENPAAFRQTILQYTITPAPQ